MDCIIIVPGLPFNGETIPKGLSLGGSETAGYYIAKGLAAKGWNVTIAAMLNQKNLGGQWDGVNYVSLEPYFTKGRGELKTDVFIGQRIPNICALWKEAKQRYFWTHDLALKRHAKDFGTQVWAMDGMFTVSDFHRKQVSKVYGYPEEFIHLLPNGVDLELFKDQIDPQVKIDGKRLVYSSRPERGLENLVGPNGLMRLLLKLDPLITLLVCGYDNTTKETEALYNQLWAWCRELPNVELLGALGKKALADVFKGAWLHVYPTIFEEVSCISVMEAQAAGTPVVASPNGALPETLKDGGVVWVGEKKENPDIELFAKAILELRDSSNRWKVLHRISLTTARSYTWQKGVDTIVEIVESKFEELTANKDKLTRHLVYMSDVVLARKEQLGKTLTDRDFGWAFKGGKEFTAHYIQQSENNRKQGWHHGFGEDWIKSLPRVVPFFNALKGLNPGTKVLDFGCSIGHFTEAFAREAPQCELIGWDIVPLDVKEGRELIKESGTKNVRLEMVPDLKSIEKSPMFDTLFIMEVFEHLVDSVSLTEALEKLVTKDGLVMVSAPSGPWEAKGKDKNHIWHFEAQDLTEIFGRKPGFSLIYIPATEHGKKDELLGHYVVAYKADHKPLGRVDLKRKLSQQAPQQSLAVCMICREESLTLAKTLDSIKDIASEIIIGVDVGKDAKKMGGSRKGRTWKIAKEYGARTLPILSPIVTGFAAARNQTIKDVKSDWILWIDDDEALEWPVRMNKYLRPNAIDAYCIPQHHFSAEPAGLMKTDFPARLFRANIGVKFYGVVHEHPERGGVGSGFKVPYACHDLAIMHFGYETEEIRRERFKRNFNLMRLDRKLNPTRVLGKFLWIRDLAHINTYMAEGGNYNIAEFRANAVEGLAIWRELIKKDEHRLVIESLPYVTTLVMSLVPKGIEFSYGIKLEHMGLGMNLNGDKLKGQVLNSDDLGLLLEMLTKQQLETVSGDYL